MRASARDGRWDARRALSWVLSAAACAAALGGWAPRADATVVTARADGVLSIESETTAAAGDAGITSLAVDHRVDFTQPPDESRLVLHTVGRTGTPFEQIEPLRLAPSSEPWCSTTMSGAFAISIVCQTAAVDRIATSLGDGDDFLLAQALTRVGDHTSTDHEDDPAIVADLGSGDDTYAGGTPFGETVMDGPGTDYVSTCCTLPAGGDRLVQPDVADPASEDAEDFLDTSYERGVVDYGARSGGQGVDVTARSWAGNDGAPGESDTVAAYGVRGTDHDDTLITAVDTEELIAHSFFGGGGDDTLRGGAGADFLDGGSGNDTLTGDIGADELSGGPGADIFNENEGEPEGDLTCGTGIDTVFADPASIDANVEAAGSAEAGCETVTRREPAPLETTVDSQPPAATNDATPTVSFSSNERRAWFECSLDGAPYQWCASPLTSPAALPDGPHVLLLRARWGTRMDETPAEVELTVDTVDPQTSVEAPVSSVHDRVDAGWTSDEQDVAFECQVDEGAWLTCTDTLDVSALAVGDHRLRVRAVDAATNADRSPAETTFTVANEAPTLSLSTSPEAGPQNLTVRAELEAADPEDDPLGYRIDFGDGSAAQSGQVGADGIEHTYTRTGVFVVRAEVDDGRAGAAATATVTVTPPEPLRPAAGDDALVVTGAAVAFDGTGSRPLAGVSGYRWDFGDGSTTAGATATHAYGAPGRYTATLTASRGGEQATDTRVITVQAPEPTGLTVTVRGGGAPLSGADVLVYDSDGRAVSAVSGAGGTVRLQGLADGAHRVLAYAPGYRPSAVSATTTNGAGDAVVDLVAGAVATGEIDSRPLSRAEVVALGINPDAPENQQVYEFSLNLEIADSLSGYVNGHGFVATDGSGWSCGPDGCVSEPSAGCDCRAFAAARDGALTTLVVPFKSKLLKEFFDIRMAVTNLAPADFSLEGSAAGLALPAGLALAPTATPQPLTKQLGSIPGGQTREAHWVVRGDEEGSYELAASAAAVLAPFGRAIAFEARSPSPLKVWGASALQLVVETDDQARERYPFRVKVGLRNVADVPVYDAAAELRADGTRGYVTQPRQRRRYGAAAVAPGETFWTGPFLLIPKDDGMVSLGQSFVGNLRGDSDDSAAITTQPRSPSFDDNPVITSKRRSNSSLTLAWQGVAGASEYRVFRAADDGTEFPAEPLDAGSVTPVPGSDTRVVVTDATFPASGSERVYAVSALVDGEWTMAHPTVPEATNVVGTSPSVDITDASVCGQRDSIVKLAFRSEDVPLASWEWSLGDGEWTPGGELDQTSHTLTPMFRRPSLSSAWLTVRVTDSLGVTNAATTQIGLCSFVALGDSFSSGEGVPPFLAGTDEDPVSSGTPNKCHRSTRAYSQVLADERDDVPPPRFVACSGAVIEDLYSDNHDDAKNPAVERQLDALEPKGSARLVTVSIGGNDAYFADVIVDCITFRVLARTPVTSWCKPLWASRVDDALTALSKNLPWAYRDIKEQAAPNARVLVVGYPPLFHLDTPFTTCEPIAWTDVVWLQTKIAEANRIIQSAAARAGVEFVDMYDRFRGRDACGSPSWFNGVNALETVFSYHPNETGQAQMADAIDGYLRQPPPGGTLIVKPSETVVRKTAVAPRQRTLTVTANWPGSDVEVSLVSPSGDTIDRGRVPSGGEHELTETSETFVVSDPVAGEWEVRLHGADVAEDGEPVQLITSQQPHANRAPVALGTTSTRGGAAPLDVGFDARDAYDPDGPLAAVDWDFGDGTSGSGVNVAHRYASAGTYEPSVTVTDGDGASDRFALPVVTVAAGGPIGAAASSGAGSGGGGGQPPAAPAVSTRASIPARGRAKVGRGGRAKFAFKCVEPAGCAARTFVLKAKAGKTRVKRELAVKALAYRTRTSVSVKLPRKLVRLVRSSGKRGLKATLGTSGQAPRRLKLTR